MALVNVLSGSSNDWQQCNCMKDFEKRMEAFRQEMEQAFPRSMVNRDLWFKPFEHNSPSPSKSFDFDAHVKDMKRHMEEMRENVRRSLDEMDAKFAQRAHFNGLEFDRVGKQEDIAPKYTNEPDGSRQIVWDIKLPKTVDPKQVNVSVKDGDIVIEANEVSDQPNESSHLHYYRRSTLPSGVDVNAIKCDLVDGRLIQVKAPIDGNSNELNHREQQRIAAY